jgi:CubicO group peptidase (beta-lactamase class C family)
MERRIRRTQEGLLLPIAIKGQPAERMRLTERMKHYGTPAVSIAVINEGRIAWSRAYGLIAKDRPEPATTETVFQAGSISKPVTAVMAQRLVQDGRLELDEDVNRRLTSWKVPDSELTKDEKVTLRRLLSHTAGVTGHAVGEYARGAAMPTLVQALEGAPPANSPARSVDIVPGTKWRYSGGGYAIVQQLLIDASHTSFPALLHDGVFARVGMSHSSFALPLPAALHAKAAIGHGRDGERLTDDWRLFPEMAAAGLWTTPTDLARLAIELQRSYAGQSEALLSRASMRAMLTRQLADYGLGLSLHGEGRTLRFGHGGDTPGYKCTLVAYAETGQGAVIMTNSDRGDRLADEILLSIAQEYAWPDYGPKEMTVTTVAPALLAAYAGEYVLDLSSDFRVTIVPCGDRLAMTLRQPTGVTEAELLPESETRFFRRDVDLQITFYRDDQNRVERLVIHQDGSEFPARKVPAPASGVGP